MEKYSNGSNYESLKQKISLDLEQLLSSELYETAKSNIRESEDIRKESILQLKTWIQQNRDIQNCLLDDNFLVRFLRVRKYSIPMAQQTLLKYLNIRQKFSQVFNNLDYTLDKMNELITAGYIYASPFRDRRGRRIIFYNFKCIDLTKITSEDVQKVAVLTYETLLENEDTQIMGVSHVMCADGLGPGHIPLFVTNDFGYLIKWGEKSFPMRHGEFTILYVSRYVKYLYDMAKLLVSPKLRERLILHNSIEEVQEKLGKKCLPLEFGGEIPEKQMIELFKEELAAKKDRLLSYDKMRLLSDKGIITRRNNSEVIQTENGGLSGSFRKLNID